MAVEIGLVTRALHLLGLQEAKGATAPPGSLRGVPLQQVLQRLLAEGGDCPRERITVEVASQVYLQASDGFVVLRAHVLPGHQDLTCVGRLGAVHAREIWHLEGSVRVDPRFGIQFAVSRGRRSLPTSREGILAYLGSGALPGIGPKTAQRLVEAFGDDTLRVLEEEPERLTVVSGIGVRRVAQIRKVTAQGRDQRQLLAFLAGFGVGPGTAARIVRTYGADAADIVRSDPYRLAEDVDGIGFRRADEIARYAGIDPAHPARLRAALLHALREAEQEGHVFQTEQQIEGRLAALGVAGDSAAAMQELAMRGLVVHDGERCCRTVMAQAERFAAEALRQRLRVAARPDSLSDLGLVPSTLTEEQARAVDQSALQPVLLVTGGPGTGKTTTVAAMVSAATARQERVVLAAPTGRAARRLTEATGTAARTLHRLLGLRPGGPSVLETIDADLVIVDEASMIDTLLFADLLRGLQRRTRLVLIGDPDQLPPVGPGEPFRQLLRSEAVPTVRLTHLFRQTAGSDIVHNAYRIRAGEPLVPGPDFIWLQEGDPRRQAEKAVQSVRRLIDQGLSLSDVQVLSAGRRHEAGVDQLNRNLQEAFNPQTGNGPRVNYGNTTLRAGDKVVQTKNDYDRAIFNGDLGTVVAVEAGQGLRVRFPEADGERDVIVPTRDLALDLGYALSVHKAQGSEYAAVVLVLSTQHFLLLRRTLFYTAVTRAKSRLVLIADRRAVFTALHQESETKRQSRLAEWVLRGVQGEANE